MKSTQLKVSRTWNSLMKSIQLQGKDGSMFNPRMFSHMYHLKTVQQSNDKGTWFGWNVSLVGPVQARPLYEQAKGFGESVMKGAVNAKHSKEEKSTVSETPY